MAARGQPFFLPVCKAGMLGSKAKPFNLNALGLSWVFRAFLRVQGPKKTSGELPDVVLELLRFQALAFASRHQVAWFLRRSSWEGMA
jgi:hypothetical protein